MTGPCLVLQHLRAQCQQEQPDFLRMRKLLLGLTLSLNPSLQQFGHVVRHGGLAELLDTLDSLAERQLVRHRIAGAHVSVADL
jgi:hypothetical protein